MKTIFLGIIIFAIVLGTIAGMTILIESASAQYMAVLPSDTDNDGIPDNIDDCPTEPETFNGYQDTDGCPDNTPTADLNLSYLTNPPSSVTAGQTFDYQIQYYNKGPDMTQSYQIITELSSGLRFDETYFSEVRNYKGNILIEERGNLVPDVTSIPQYRIIVNDDAIGDQTITVIITNVSPPDGYTKDNQIESSIHVLISPSSLDEPIPSEILDNNLLPLVSETIMSINDKIGQNVIGVSEVKPIERVTVENTDQIINDFVHKTAFLDLSDNRVTISTLGQFPNKIKYENHFKQQLSTPQEWPFANGKKIALLQPDDVVAEISWINADTSNQYTTWAILDESGQVKFEPLMYFSIQQNDIIQGDTLEVTNFFGWRMIKADLKMLINTDDTGCEIMTPEGRIAIVEIETGPIWSADHIQSDNKWTKGQCHKDQLPIPQKNTHCAEARAIVAYSAFFPNWNISQTEFKITQGDLPMAGGIKTLIIPEYCIPEFPITALLILTISISGIVIFVRSKSGENLLIK